MSSEFSIEVGLCTLLYSFWALQTGKIMQNRLSLLQGSTDQYPGSLGVTQTRMS